MNLERLFMMLMRFLPSERKSFRIWDKNRTKRNLCYVLSKLGIKSAWTAMK